MIDMTPRKGTEEVGEPTGRGSVMNVSVASVVVHERNKKDARQMSSLWRYIVIDAEGNTQKNPLMGQDDLLRMFPEVAPRFFENFGVDELVIRQKNGTQLILKKVR